jgi:site-specific DNA-cytosine methylase
MTRERVALSVRTMLSRLMPSSDKSKAILDVETLAFFAARVAKITVFPSMPLFLMREREAFIDANKRDKNCVLCAPDIPERDNTFVFISLYSGAGITIAGLRSAGGILALAVESDNEKRKILRLNNPGVKILDDVSHVNDEVIREISDRYDVVHLIEAGVPCKDVSGENNFRGKKSLEKVLFPFLEVFRVADLVFTESMKRKTNDFVAPLVLIENVECIAKRWDVVNPPYLVNLMEMCADRKMGYAYRTLSAESAGGLNLTRTRMFFVATRSKEINLERVMLFAEDETTNIECKRECVYSWNRSGCGLCFLCINASRNAREANRNPFSGAKVEQKFRFRAVNIASQRSVGSEATTTATNVTATNASSLILVDKLGLFKPAFVSLNALSKMFDLSAGKFFFENDDASSTSSYKRMLGDSATCTLPYILGRAFVMDKMRRARASPFEKKKREEKPRFFISMTEHYKNDRRFAASLFLNKGCAKKRSRQNSRALATFPSQHGVLLLTTAYDKDYNETNRIDFFVGNMKFSKVALCVPTRVESQAWKKLSDDAMDEMESVPDARLKTFRAVMRREAQSAAFMKLGARVRSGLGFTHKDTMNALKLCLRSDTSN